MTFSFIAGLDRLRAHVPSLRSRSGRVRLLVSALAALGLPTAYFVLLDKFFAAWMPDGEIVVLALGFLILSRFFSQKQRYQARFGDQAYARALTSFVMPGLGIVFASILHLAYIPGPHIPQVWWKPFLIALGWLSLAVAAVLWWRAVSALGADYLAMLHVYHPEDRRLVDWSIYRVIRHPVYAAALHISTGLALVHANWYALLVALVIPLFFLGWIALVEEKELTGQIPGYQEYRRSVPAFTPRIRDLGTFWRILILGA